MVARSIGGQAEAVGMTLQLRDVLFRSAQALLRSRARFDAGTRDAVEEIFASLDHLDGQGHSPAADRRSARAAFAKRLRAPGAAFTSAEKNLLDGGDARILNLAEGTGSAGGFLLPSLLSHKLVDRLKFYSSVATVARVIETDTGDALGVPTTDDTANPATLLAEAATAPASDFVFGLQTLGAYKFSSGIVSASIEMLQDSAIDIAGMILDLFGKRLGRGQNTFFTTGTGTAQPQGVVTGSSLGFVLPVGNTTSLTYAGLVQLYQSVDPAYRSSPACVWEMNDNSLLAVKSLVDNAAGANRPLWLPDVLPQEPGSPFHGTLLGKPVVVNNDMANMAANAKPVIFGDFSQYAIRMMRGAAMMQLDDSAYASKGQVAFIMFSRADGRILIPQAIKYLQNSAT